MKPRRIQIWQIVIILVFGFMDAAVLKCPPGLFVINGHCSGICHCLKNDTCDSTDGRCLFDLCAEGYTGNNCQEKCPPGKHGRNCKLTCHCRQNVSCRINGNCRDLCSVGYGGRACTYQILQSLITLMPDGIEIFEADRTQFMDSNANLSCSSIPGFSVNPHNGEKRKWIEVKLADFKYVQRVKIKIKTCEYCSRRIRIMLSFPSPIFPNHYPPESTCKVSNLRPTLTHHLQSLDVLCNLPQIASVIRIYSADRRDLYVCSIEVPECVDFTYGPNCNHQCACLDKSEVCNKITGGCRSGCPRSLPFHVHCQEEVRKVRLPRSADVSRFHNCPHGTYGRKRGQTCVKRCSCENKESECENDGKCSNIPENSCQRGKYLVGERGKEKCNGVCRCENNSCDHYGHCTNNSKCEDHFTGHTCEKCEDRRFGKHCEMQCNCVLNENCDANGRCENGCLEGWTGPTCQDIAGSSSLQYFGMIAGGITAVMLLAAGIYLYKTNCNRSRGTNGRGQKRFSSIRSKHSSEQILFTVKCSDLPSLGEDDVTTSGVCRTKNYYKDLTPAAPQSGGTSKTSTHKQRKQSVH